MVDLKGSSIWLKKGNIKVLYDVAFRFLQNRNFLQRKRVNYLHCNSTRKTVDHLVTRCDRMLSFDYTKRHNEVLRCIHLLMCLRYGLNSSKKIRNHSVQEIVCNEEVGIRVDNIIKTNVKIRCSNPDLFIHDKINFN
ncbi:hypothetical protein NUSPORA_02971 [Nucleospora cyclopteri]